MKRFVIIISVLASLIGCTAPGISQQTQDKAIALVREKGTTPLGSVWGLEEEAAAFLLGVETSITYRVFRGEGESSPDIYVVEPTVKTEDGKTLAYQWRVNVNTGAVEGPATTINGVDQATLAKEGEKWTDRIVRLMNALWGFYYGEAFTKSLQESSALKQAPQPVAVPDTDR